MSFSFSKDRSEIQRLQEEQALFAARKSSEESKKAAARQESDSAANSARYEKARNAELEVSDIVTSLNQQKALDAAKKQKANYDAGIVDPDVAASEAIAKKSALDKATESGMTDFQKYSQKNDYDLGNQSKAWESANMYRMREADQSNVAQKDRLVSQLDNQKAMQRATIDQANKLRSDDNQRAIDGFKLKF
jgi:hypothetical protein